MSNLIDSRDLEESIKMALDYLEDSNERLEEDVADIVLANDGRNRDMKDFEKHLEIAITYIDLYNREKNRRSVFDNDRDMCDAVGKALTYAVAGFAANDKKLLDELGDRDYDDVMENAEKLEKMADALEDLEEESRRGSRRGRGRRDDRRDNRRSRDRGRDRETGRSSTRTSYRRNNRGDDRDDRRESRRDRKRDENRSKTAYGRNTRKDDNRKEQADTMQVNPDEILISVPRQTPVKSSKVKPQTLPNEDISRVFNPTTHGAYAIAGEEGVFRAVLEHEGEEVEDYSAHELNRNLVAHDRKGERVVPVADFRGIKDPSDDMVDGDEEPREPTIVYSEQINCVATGERIPTHVLTGVLNADADYQVIRMNKYLPLTVVVSVMNTVNDEIGELYNMKRFNDFYSWITKAQEKKEDLSNRSERFAMLNCLNTLADHLTKLANNLFGIVSNIPGMDNFIEDWPAAHAWLIKPDNSDIYSVWQELEAQYLRHNLAVLSDDDAKAAAAKGEIELIDEGNQPIQNLWVRSQPFVVLVDGDISGAIQMSNPELPAKVDYEMTPDFHTACTTLVNHRNRNMSMANIILIDTVGSQYCILANKNQVPVIKVRML